MYRSILVPLDGSVFGEHALPLAVSLARRAAAGLQLVHVYVPLQATYGADGVVFDAALDDRLKQGRQEYLDGVVKRLAQVADLRVTPVLLEGPDVATSLRAVAAETAADLVVMTTHGRGAMGRFWLGSVAHELLRQLSMPLLLAHPHGETIDWSREPRLRHFLVPLDESPFAEQILEPVAALAGVMGAEITLERVLGVVPLDDPGIDHIGLSSPALQVLDQVRTIERRVREQAEQYLARVAERLRARGLRVRTRVAVAEQPVVAILEEAKASAIDLIALASHGRRGLSRVLLGSVADKVIRAAPTPVLVQRPLRQ